jgi:hypothetical protein
MSWMSWVVATVLWGGFRAADTSSRPRLGRHSLGIGPWDYARRTLRVGPRGRDVGPSRYLTTKGLAANTTGVTVGTVLGVILGDEETEAQTLYKLPTVILTAGFVGWMPDIRNSTVTTRLGVLGAEVQVAQAKIVCTMPTAGVLLNMAGVELTLGDVVLSFEDAREMTQSVALSRSATFAGATVSILMTLDSDGSRDLTISLANDATMTCLSALLPGNRILGSLIVPFSELPISSLSTSGVGVVVMQPIQGANNYAITSAFATISFMDLNGVLPAGFPLPQKGQ